MCGISRYYVIEPSSAYPGDRTAPVRRGNAAPAAKSYDYFCAFDKLWMGLKRNVIGLFYNTFMSENSSSSQENQWVMRVNGLKIVSRNSAEALQTQYVIRGF